MPGVIAKWLALSVGEMFPESEESKVANATSIENFRLRSGKLEESCAFVVDKSIADELETDELILVKEDSHKYFIDKASTHSTTGKYLVPGEIANVFHKPISGKLFEECYTPFCYILKNKLGLDLPAGQASHVLRHSFASHFMMNGGNILVLRDILGHADIQMTMRYAHFSPDHLSDAMTKNPLVCL